MIKIDMLDSAATFGEELLGTIDLPAVPHRDDIIYTENRDQYRVLGITHRVRPSLTGARVVAVVDGPLPNTRA